MSKSSIRISSLWTIALSVLVLTFSIFPQKNDDIQSRAKVFVSSTEARLQHNFKSHERYFLLKDLAPAAFAAGDLKKAEKYARELQTVGDTIKNESKFDTRIPSYANHVSNIILGLIALNEDKVIEAKEHLLAAAQISGGPDPLLTTFGPNMLLAKKLIEKGERETVIQYFDLCAKFWERENGRLEKWKNTVNQGGMPDFGANLGYAVDTWRFRQI